jgi:isopenicillin N synthase-like dioxygenase
VAQLRDICTRVEFFHINDHDVPQGTLGATFKSAKTLFSLDIETEIGVRLRKKLGLERL